jgi:hypothetical protein
MLAANTYAALTGIHRESQPLGGMRPKSFSVVWHQRNNA